MNESKNGTRNSAIRIDRWLWFTRFYKTRGLAAAAVSGGHVKLNGERAKPGSRVNQGDAIELVRDKLPYNLTAGPLPVRRGPASEALQCYLEDETSVLRRRQIVDGIRQDRRQMPRTDGKPDKHTRRKLRERNRGQNDADQ
jgi:ribosome-associated heat shock protein Hsp15